jgi:hypothetical protein
VDIWLILGPSGAGKSSFGEWLAAERNWLHLEIDQYPKDGIDAHSLRREWNEFYDRGNAKLLAGALKQRFRANSKIGCAITFSGCLVLRPDQILAAAGAGIRTVCLYGSAARCIAGFLKREQKSGRRLGLEHWILNSYQNGSYIEMSKPAYAPYRIHVFTHTGTRRPHAEVFETLLIE